MAEGEESGSKPLFCQINDLRTTQISVGFDQRIWLARRASTCCNGLRARAHVRMHYEPKRLQHPYPDWRLDVMTRGGSPVR